jgi:putative spermidine/putrescine transport system substrate-binding protein
VAGLDRLATGQRPGGRVLRRVAGEQQACGYTADKTFCATYHASDAAYASKIWYWTTPTAQCLDGRTNVTCKDYSAWTQAWTEIKG